MDDSKMIVNLGTALQSSLLCNFQCWCQVVLWQPFYRWIIVRRGKVKVCWRVEVTFSSFLFMGAKKLSKFVWGFFPHGNCLPEEKIRTRLRNFWTHFQSLRGRVWPNDDLLTTLWDTILSYHRNLLDHICKLLYCFIHHGEVRVGVRSIDRTQYGPGMRQWKGVICSREWDSTFCPQDQELFQVLRDWESVECKYPGNCLLKES